MAMYSNLKPVLTCEVSVTFEFQDAEGRNLGSCTFPAFERGELIDIDDTEVGWRLVVKRPPCPEPTEFVDTEPMPDTYPSPYGVEGGRRC